MQFHVTENGVLRVMVSDAELVRFGLSFDELNEQCPKTRSALTSVLRTAKEQCGFEPPHHLCIEAMPIDGGCLLLFSPDGSHRRWRPRRAAPMGVWRFENADALLGFSAALRPLSPALEKRREWCASSLFAQRDAYDLVVYAPSMLPRGVLGLLSEFAEHIGGGVTAAAVEEHATPVCIREALLKLTAYSD